MNISRQFLRADGEFVKTHRTGRARIVVLGMDQRVVACLDIYALWLRTAALSTPPQAALIPDFVGSRATRKYLYVNTTCIPTHLASLTSVS